MIRLKELRLKKNMTRKEVAEKLDIKPRTYLSYENNEREPNSEMLIVFANFFDVTIDYLIGRTDTPTERYKGGISKETLRSDEEQLLTNYNKLNITGKDKSQEYTKDLTENKKYTVVKKYPQQHNYELVAFGGANECSFPEIIEETT